MNVRNFFNKDYSRKFDCVNIYNKSVWATSQLSPWLNLNFSNEFYRDQLRHVNITNPNIVLYRLQDNECYPIEKPDYLEKIITSNVHNRRILYKHFIDLAIRKRESKIQTIIAVCLEDLDPSPNTIPIFSFQKDRKSKSILLPDPDFFYFSFYDTSLPYDVLPYQNKFDRAIFIGATTGCGTITKNKILEKKIPRVNSFHYFQNSKFVDFYLPKIVQCENSIVETMLRQMGVGQNVQLSLDEQYSHKFIISIDGNGAACSRVCTALKSNSVLMKYDSDSVLYYFQYLLPWVHYIPICSDSDVERFIKLSNNGFSFEDISYNSKRFFDENLTMSQVLIYFNELITKYARYIGPTHKSIIDSDLL
jgi:hypothetical protein